MFSRPLRPEIVSREFEAVIILMCLFDLNGQQSAYKLEFDKSTMQQSWIITSPLLFLLHISWL